MVKKNRAAEPAPAGWGSPQPHPDPVSLTAPPEDAAPGISSNPEDRQPPLDEGWGDEQRPVMGMAAAAPTEGVDPAPAKPKKSKKGEKGLAPADHVPPAASPQRNSDPLIGYVERLERLAEERATITDDMKEVVAEAKGSGYDSAILKKVLARRKRGREAVLEEEALIDTYQNVVGWGD